MDQSVTFALLVGLVTLAIIYYHRKVFSFWSSRGVNGPTPWPIFGTGIYYIFWNKLDVDEAWHKKYGKTYGVYEGYSPVLRTHDCEIIKHVYIKQFSSFTDRNSHSVHGDNNRRWLFWVKGDLWSNQRVLVSPMFTSNRMRGMFVKISECIDNFLNEVGRRHKSNEERLLKQVAGKDDLDEITKVKAILESCKQTEFSKNDIMALTLDVIAQSFFSIKLDTYRDKANEFLQRAYQFATIKFYWFIIWLLLPNRVARYFKIDLIPESSLKYFEKLSQTVIDERRHNVSSRKEDFIQMMIEAKIPEKYENIYTDEDDKEAHYSDRVNHKELERIQQSQTQAAKLFRHFSDEEIRGTMTFFFLAGFDTTATTITFSLYELAHHPATQDEIHQELVQNMGSEAKLDYSSLLNMKKLDSFVCEVLRLYNPIIVSDRLVTDKEGVTLPTNPPLKLPYDISISTNFYIVHRDEDYFENANEFDPTRFYPENRGKIKSCTYGPFGIGPRNCAGMRFALLEVKLFLARVILGYLVKPGTKSQAYPPEYKNNSVFLQFKHTDFKLIPRIES